MKQKNGMNASKKLLVIHRALAPYRIELLNVLSAAFDAHIYFEYASPIEQRFDASELAKRVHFRSEVLPPAPSLIGLKNYRPYATSLVRSLRPDAVLCSEFNLLTLMLAATCRLFSPATKLYVLCDDNEQMAESELRYGQGLKHRMLSYVDGVILCDSRATELYAARYATLDRERFVYFPILQDEKVLRPLYERAFSQGRKERDRLVPQGHRMMLYVGRLSEEKNLPALIGSLSRLPEDVHLVLVGDGPMLPTLIGRVGAAGLSERVTFVGKKEGSDLYAYYTQADCLVLPSTRECFGSVVNEALVSGVPVICSRIAGASCLISSQNGRVFDPMLPEDLTRACTDLLEGLPPFRGDSLRPSLMPYSFDEAIRPVLTLLDR